MRPLSPSPLWGGVGEGTFFWISREQMPDPALDFHEHMIGPIDDLPVIEVKNRKSLAGQERVSRDIVCLASERLVAVAIDFNDQSSGKPSEVSDIRTDRCLPTKSRTVRSQIAEHAPHFPFSFGQLPAKDFGTATSLHLDV
jgi:hypothetical protein